MPFPARSAAAQAVTEGSDRPAVWGLCRQAIPKKTPALLLERRQCMFFYSAFSSSVMLSCWDSMRM